MTNATAVSAWAPLRIPVFRRLWVAQHASNAGTWMQLVAAQWLVGSLGGSALLVALVQTATTLPVALLVLVAGAFSDTVDRRRLLLVVQVAMLTLTALLAALTAAGTMTIGLLLLLTLLLGIGQALLAPTWQALQPELVPRAQIAQAATLNATGFNLSRAVGPALGGVAVAVAGPAAAFGLNALSFLGITAVLTTWRRPSTVRAHGTESLGAAVRLGLRYVRNAPAVRRLLLRAALLLPSAGALWALLPVLARGPLGLDAAGYGLLLGTVGAGAVTGALLLPRLRRRLPPDLLLTVAALVLAAALVTLGAVRLLPVVVLAAGAAGAAWISALSTFNATLQLILPGWARARVFAFYLLVVYGSQALAGVTWGVLTETVGLPRALAAAGVLLAAAAVLPRRRLRLPRPDLLDPSPSAHWPEPVLAADPGVSRGPVQVLVEYRVDPAATDAFTAAMARLGRSRRRSGAQRWALTQDGADPTRFVESYLMFSWEEHLRQHHERLTATDQRLQQEVYALLDEPPQVRHLFTPGTLTNRPAIRP